MDLYSMAKKSVPAPIKKLVPAPAKKFLKRFLRPSSPSPSPYNQILNVLNEVNVGIHDLKQSVKVTLNSDSRKENQKTLDFDFQDPGSKKYLPQLQATFNILNSTDAEFNSYDFILNQIKGFGLGNFDWYKFGDFLKWRNESEFGLQQIPTEFARFAMFLSKLKISTFAEVGVYRGCSSYFLAAMVQRSNPEVKYSMIDIADYIEGYEYFSKLLNLEKLIPGTSKDVRGQRYDFVFIDGDHSYDGVKEDFLNLGQYCNVGVGYHDIHAHEYDSQKGGTVRWWNEFKDNYSDEFSMYEFSDQVRWMGLGVGLRKPTFSDYRSFITV